VLEGLDVVLAAVETNAHPYDTQLTALFLSLAPVIFVFIFIIVAALRWRYRTRKRARPTPRTVEIGQVDAAKIDMAKEEERRH
jgi:heme/copper-type cytochrome/quinol oxidase subunit 2